MLLFGEAAATDVRAAATGTRGCNAAAGGVWYARNCRQYRWAAGRLLLREGAAASRASSGLMLQGRGCYWLGVRLLPRWARILLKGWADAIGRGVAATCGGAGGRLPPVGGCCCRRACGCSYSSCGCSRRGAPTPGGLLPVQGGGRDRWGGNCFLGGGGGGVLQPVGGRVLPASARLVLIVGGSCVGSGAADRYVLVGGRLLPKAGRLLLPERKGQLLPPPRQKQPRVLCGRGGGCILLGGGCCLCSGCCFRRGGGCYPGGGGCYLQGGGGYRGRGAGSCCAPQPSANYSQVAASLSSIAAAPAIVAAPLHHCSRRSPQR